MAGNVVSQEDWFSWSLNQFAREFGIARETVQRRISDSGISQSGERRGFPVYRVSQVARAILAPEVRSGFLINDPEKMSPKERADWYKSENDRIKFERESGVVIHATDSRQQMAVIAKTGLQVLETLPDILERDFSLQSEIITEIEEKIDVLRNQWADLIEELE